MQHQHVLDTEGLYCPEPVMMLHSKIAEVSVGEVVLLKASDPATERDVPKFCQFLGHKLLGCDHKNNAYNYYIEKV
jgi:tRNA 2-thiouridine synthesizing protein A